MKDRGFFELRELGDILIFKCEGSGWNWFFRDFCLCEESSIFEIVRIEILKKNENLFGWIRVRL